MFLNAEGGIPVDMSAMKTTPDPAEWGAWAGKSFDTWKVGFLEKGFWLNWGWHRRLHVLAVIEYFFSAKIIIPKDFKGSCPPRCCLRALFKMISFNV